MKLAVRLLVATLAVCQIYADVPIDREYRYNYRARVASGIADDVKQFSAFGIEATLIIQNQGNYYYVKLDNVKAGQMNDKITVDMAEEFPMSYHEFSGAQTNEKEALTKPIRITYEKGLVKTFDYTAEDPEWSLNMKRAIMSLFQLNFDRVNPVRFSKSNYLKHDENNDNFFRVMENGIGGECETIYEINSHPYYKRPYERVLNVTKHRSYEHCTGQRPIVFQSTHRGYKCDNCKHVDPLQAISTTEYQIHGDRYYHTVEKISNIGKYLFTPFGTESFTGWSGVNQTLVLASTYSIKEPINFPSTYETSTSLKYNHTDNPQKHEDTSNVDLHKPNYYYRSNDYDFNKYKEKAGEYLNDLSQKFDVTEEDFDKKNYPQKISKLVKLLGTMSFEELQEVWNTHLNYDYKSAVPEKQLQKQAFFDMLAITGTNPTVSFIIHAAKEKYLPGRVAARYFDRMAHYVKDHSESLLEHFLEFTESLDKTNQRELYKTFWLVFGSLVNHGCIYDNSLINGFHHIRQNKCNSYVDLVSNHFKKSTEIWEQTLYMKVAGNMGLSQFYAYLKPIVTGQHSYQLEVREPALIAFFKIMQELREEGLTVAVPLFYNHSEPVSIRLTAFQMILSVNPSYESLQAIGERLRNEPSRQVASYVYSSFKALANSTNPCKQEMGEKSRRVLQNIPEYFYGYHYAQQVLLGYFNDKFNFGSETTIAWSGSNDSLVPEHVFLEKSSNIFGQNIDLFAIDFRGTGFSRFYNQLFANDGQYDPKDDKKSILNLIRRHPRSVNTNDKEAQELQDSMKIADREPTPIHGSLSMWMFNQEHKYFNFDEKDIPTYSQNGHFYLPKELPEILKQGLKLNIQKSLMLSDVSYEMPNEMGFPVSLSWHYPGYVQTKGQIKLDVQPGFFPEDRDFKKPTNVRLSVDVQPAFHFRGIAHVAVKTPFQHSYGLGVNHDISMKYPVKIEADYDVKEKKLHVNYKPSQSKYQLLNIKTFPYTYIDKRKDFELEVDDEHNVKSVHFKEPTTNSASIGQKYFGVGLTYEEQSEYPWNNFGAFYKFIGSFFTKKSRTFDSYNYAHNWLQRVIPAWQHFKDFMYLSPQIIPVDMKVNYEPDKQNPTTEFDLTLDFEKYLKTATKSPLPPVNSEVITDVDPTYRKFWAVHADLTAKGNEDRNYKLNVSTSRDYYNILRKVVFEYERTPIPNYDAEPFKFCAYGSGKVPYYDEWYSFDEHLEKKAELTYNINFGKDCTSDRKIDANIVIEKSDEQKRRDTEHSYPLYKACLEDLKEGYNSTRYPCWASFIEYYTLNKWTIDIHHENLPDYFKSYMDKMTYWAKYYWFTNIKHVNKNVKNPPNHVKLVANYSMDEPARLDLSVYRPDMDIFYEDIYYPKYYPFFKQFNLRFDQKRLLFDSIFQWKQNPICILEKDSIATFDTVIYKFQPPVNNYYILAKDCSKNNNFLVMAKQLQHPSFKKSLKMFILGTKIEILPLEPTSPLVVRVDDVVKTLKQQSVLLVPDTKRPGQLLLKIIRTGTQYIVESKYAGIRVTYNGYYVYVNVDNNYRGKACGLCGNLDGEEINEFAGPKGCVYNNEQAFGYSWVVPSDTFSIPEAVDNTCIYPYAPKYIGKCTLRRNKVIHDVPVSGSGTKAKNVCFSTQPVPECAPGCKVANGQYVKRKVGFHCLNANDRSTGDMISRSTNMQAISELQNKSQDYYEVVQYPEQCVKA